MSQATREQVSVALFALLSSVSSFVYKSRRLQTFANISSSIQMPALFLEEEPEQHVRNKMPTPAIRTLEYTAYIFISAGLDPNATPITTLNNIIDAIDPLNSGVLKPDDIPQNRQTLGGLVYDCYIEGTIEKIPGDIDGIGAARIPIKAIFNR
jgi:hypothetical protein